MRNSTFLVLVFLCLSCSENPFGCGEGDFKYTITVENSTSMDLSLGLHSAKYVSCDVKWRRETLVAPANSVTEFKLKTVKAEKAGSYDMANVEVDFKRSSNNVEVRYPPNNVDFSYKRYSVSRKDDLYISLFPSDCNGRNRNITMTTINSSDTTIWTFYRVSQSKVDNCRNTVAPACISYPCFGGNPTYLEVPPGADTTITVYASQITLQQWSIGSDPHGSGEAEHTSFSPTPLELGSIWGTLSPEQDSVFVEFTSYDRFEVRGSR